MELIIEDVSFILPEEQHSVSRELRMRNDGGILHFDIINKDGSNSALSLTKKQVELLRDSINLYLKNNLIEDDF